MKITPELLLEALTGKLRATDIELLTGDLRALPPASVLSLAVQGGLRMRGDGNIVGNNNTSIVVKGKGAAELARVLRETLERGRALFQLRPPVVDFVGREQEIAKLTSALRAGRHVGISGMGGSGKTELALLIAGRVRENYPDAHLFINLHGNDSNSRRPEDALAICIHALVGPEVKLPDELDELTTLYRSQLSGKRALVVLDSAADSTQIRPLLPPQGSVLLVTSRLKLTLSGMTRVVLDQLPPVESRLLLMSIAPRSTPDVADEISLLCGYLPLAIRAAGSLLDVTIDLEPSDYAAQLRDERTRIERIGGAEVDVGVEASFSVSYERLQAEAASVFRKLAVFPASFDAEAEEKICADGGHFQLSELVRRSLVLYDEGAKRYHLHDLVRLFADARLTAAERGVAQQLYATHYKDLLANAEILYVAGGEAIRRGLALFDREWGNIQAGQRWATTQAETDDQAAQLCVTYPEAGAHLLSLRQHSRECINWLEASLTVARRLKRRRSEAAALGNLGRLYSEVGESRRAIECNEQHLVIARELGDRKSEGRALGNLGNAYMNLGETKRAIDLYEQTLSITRETSDRRGESISLINLGNAYSKLRKTNQAIEFYERGLLIARELGDRRVEGSALGNLSALYLVPGRTKQAIELNEQHLAIARELGDRRSEGNALGILGIAYLDLGETKRAIEFYEQHLTIAREIGDRRGEGNALWNMSLALDKIGDRVKAFSCAQESLRICEQIEDANATKVREQLDLWRQEKPGIRVKQVKRR